MQDRMQERVQDRMQEAGFPRRRHERDDDAVQFRIPESLSVAVARLAARLQVSEMAIYLAAYVLLLARVTGRPAVQVALDRADLAAAALPLLLGTLGEASLAPIAIDTRISGDRLLSDVHSLARSIAGPGRAADALPPQASLPAASDRVAGFRCGVRLTPETIEFDGLAVESVPVAADRRFDTGQSETDLALAYEEPGLSGEWRFDRRQLDEATVRGWIACYQTLLRSLASESDSPLALLELLPDEQLQLMTGWNAAAGPGGAPSLQERVAQEAARTPERIALHDGTTSVSWRDLEARSNRLARHLQLRGALPGVRVGILMKAGIERMIAQLAVLKTGAACLPLDAGWRDRSPRQLLRPDILNLAIAASRIDGDASVPLVLLDEEAGVIARQPEDAFELPVAAAFDEEPAFVVRKPADDSTRLVVLPRRAVASAARCLGSVMELGAGDTLLAVTQIGDDGLSLDVLAALAAGAQVRLAVRESTRASRSLRPLLEQGGVTAMVAPASVWQALLDDGWPGRPGFKAALPAIEASAPLAAALLAGGVHVWCLYGSIEATGMAAAMKIDDPDQLGRVEEGESDRAGRIIGRPHGISAVWVCDAHGQPCPIGVAGELYVGGECLASGYLGERPLSADRFVPDALGAKAGRKLFRTLERGRWRHDGLLEYLGACEVPAAPTVSVTMASAATMATMATMAAEATPTTARYAHSARHARHARHGG